jgi:hypothetical protein
MSNTVQHKMYNYEATPPAQAWDKIAIVLDEVTIDSKLKKTLHSIAPAPSSFIWDKIATDLDNITFENKFNKSLSSVEATPPAFMWDKIKAELNNSDIENELHDRLYGLDVKPPVTSWQQIIATMDAEKEVLTIPPVRRISPILKYAAAAALVGVMAWGGISLLNNNKPVKTEVAQEKNTGSKKGNVPTATEKDSTTSSEKNIAATNNLPTPDQERRNDIALEESKRTVAKLDVPSKNKLKNVADFYFSTDIPNFANSRIVDYDVPPDDNSYPNDRYIMLMTPDGNIIRVSKKLGSLVSCVSGAEQNKTCTEQVKKWREKLANSSMTNSASNFIDILDMVSSLQENND